MKIDEVARKAKYHHVLDALSFVDRFLIRTLIKLTVLVHKRIGDRYSVGFVFWERDEEDIVQDKRNQFKVVKDDE